MNIISTGITKFLTGIGCILPILAVGFFVISLFNGFRFIGFVISVIVFLVGLFIIGQGQLMQDGYKEKQKKILLSLNSGQPRFEKMPSIMSIDLLKRIVIDHDKQRIYIWYAEDGKGNVLRKPKLGMSYKLLNYDFTDLVAAAIVEDDTIIMSSPEFADISTISGENKKHASTNTMNMPMDKVKTMELILQIDDEIFPFFQFKFYDASYKDLLKESIEYNAVLKEMRKAYNRFDSILNGSAENLVPVAPLSYQDVSSKSDEVPAVMEPSKIQPIEREKKRHEETVAPPHEIDQPTYTFSDDLADQSIIVERSEIEKDSFPDQDIPAEQTELSYFERIIAENKRQLTERK